MYNAHIISHFAATAERLSALAYKVRGNVGLSIEAEIRAKEARAYMAAEQRITETNMARNFKYPRNGSYGDCGVTDAAAFTTIPVAAAIDPDEEAGAAAYRSADHADKRCPFRRPERVAAWHRGFNQQHAERLNA